MAMSVGNENAEEAMMSEINTTPLVDVMLVLLIIFLVTIPVITKTVPVKLPKAANVGTITKPENINISITEDGNVYWNQVLVPDTAQLLERSVQEAVKVPQPEVHIRADANARYEFVGRAYVTFQRAGIAKVAFLSEPDRGFR
jgi:biopolymer transport protein ExbD